MKHKQENPQQSTDPKEKESTRTDTQTHRQSGNRNPTSDSGSRAFRDAHFSNFQASTNLEPKRVTQGDIYDIY